MGCEVIIISGSNVDNIIENMNKLKIKCKYTVIEFDYNNNNYINKGNAEVVNIKDFIPDKVDNQYLIVVSSGTILQLKEVVQKFSLYNIAFSLVELESDKIKTLWPELIQ